MTATAVWSGYTVVNCCFITACGHWQKILAFGDTAFYLPLTLGTAFLVGHMCWPSISAVGKRLRLTTRVDSLWTEHVFLFQQSSDDG